MVPWDIDGPSRAETFLRNIVQQRGGASNAALNFDTTALDGIENILASPGKVRCDFFVSSKMQNRYNTLHGGCSATIVDTVGTAAIATVHQDLGVSLSININYISPMPSGEKVSVEATVVKVGKTVATVKVELRRKSTDQLIAVGIHTKFLRSGKQSEPGDVQLASKL